MGFAIKLIGLFSEKIKAILDSELNSFFFATINTENNIFRYRRFWPLLFQTTQTR